jgi:uncharacterized membrane protein
VAAKGDGALELVKSCAAGDQGFCDFGNLMQAMSVIPDFSTVVQGVLAVAALGLTVVLAVVALRYLRRVAKSA